MPASFMAAMSAMASPLLATEAAPMGHTRTLPATLARSSMKRVTEALSLTGVVLGMQQTAVNPPRAAAPGPAPIVSEHSCPGWRRWAGRSMKPGATIKPAASKPSASLGVAIFPAGASSFIFAPSRRTSRAASVLEAGSRTRPFLTSSMRGILLIGGAAILGRQGLGHRMGAVFMRAGDQQKQKRHANGD